MAAAEQSLQEPHEFASTLEERCIFVHEVQLRLFAQVRQALLQQARRLPEPGHDEAYDRPQELVCLKALALRVRTSAEDKVHQDKQLASQVLGHGVGGKSSEIPGNQIIDIRSLSSDALGVKSHALS